MDCSLPGSSVHGILQAGILEWVAMCSSQIASGKLLYSTGSSAQCPVMAQGGVGGCDRSFQGGALKAGRMLRASGYASHLSDRLRGAVESLGA